jgi:hypothetical protein
MEGYRSSFSHCEDNDFATFNVLQMGKKTKQNNKAQSNQYVAKCLLHTSLRDLTPDNVTKSTAHQAGFTGNNNVSKGSNALLKP